MGIHFIPFLKRNLFFKFMMAGTRTLLIVFSSQLDLALGVLAKGFLILFIGAQVTLGNGRNPISSKQTFSQTGMGAAYQFVALDITQATGFLSGSSTSTNVMKQQSISVSAAAEASSDFYGFLSKLPQLMKKESLVPPSPKRAFVKEALFEEDGDLEERDLHLKDEEIDNLKSANQRFFWVGIFGGILIVILISILIASAFRQRRLVKEKIIAKEVNSSLNQAIQTKDLEMSAQNVHFSQLKKLLEVKNSAPVLDKNKGTRLGTYEAIKPELDIRITEDKGDFYKILLAAHPDLKPSELKLCSYLRLNLSTKELAELLNKSGRTIENTRFSIRKKMCLKPDDNLVTHLINLEKKSINKPYKSVNTLV